MAATDTTQADTSITLGDRIVCRDCPAGAEDEVRGAWTVQRLRLARQLKHLRTPDYHFTVVVTRTRRGYEARLTLALESGTLAARAERESIDGAIGHAADQLDRELARHLSMVHNERLMRRRRRRRSDLDAAEPLLAADRASGDEGAFVEALRPYLAGLRDLARHEILAAELEHRMTPGDVTAGDLLDALLARAWERYEARPKEEPLDSWLVRQLFEVADEKLGGPLAAAGAETSAAPRTDDERGGEPGGEAEELMQQVNEALRGVPATQRRAFMLAAFDGWTEEEIGMLLRRRPEEVRADIEAARARVRERLGAREGTV